nr:hypothetical protein T459_07725 [Ipomoea batatas]
MDDTLLAACNLNGHDLPKKEIKIGEEANFTVNLRDDKDIETMTCDLRSGDKHGSFVMFDTLNWNVSSYCAPHNVCIWKVVPRGLCLSPQFFNCPVIYYWP